MPISREVLKLDEVDMFQTSHTSKGDQLKFKLGDKYVKINKFGYEDVAEVLCSEILSCSNLSENMFVKYKLCTVEYNGSLYNGCYSIDFLKPTQSLVTLSKIMTKYEVGIECSQNIKNVVKKYIKDINNIVGFDISDYLYDTMTFDAFVLNIDRHFNNLAVIINKDGSYERCPLFDNGLSLLSSYIHFPQYIPLANNIINAEGKPFSTEFKEQFRLGGDLYLDKDKFDKVLDNPEVDSRIRNILEYQASNFNDIFYKPKKKGILSLCFGL